MTQDTEREAQASKRHHISTSEATSSHLDHLSYIAEVILAADKKSVTRVSMVRRAVAFYVRYLDRLIDEAGVKGVPPELIQGYPFMDPAKKGVTPGQFALLENLWNERAELERREKKQWKDPVEAAQPWRKDQRPLVEQLQEDIQQMEQEEHEHS